MTKIILIRHGETEVNAEGKTHSTGDTASLTKLGRKKISSTVEAIKNLNVKQIVCSDEERALESAEILAGLLNLEIEIEGNLRERNWGELEGKPWSEIKEILDKFTLEERYTYLPPGGESWQGFESRIYEAIGRLRQKFVNTTFVVVSHGGVIRALITKLLNLPKEESFKYDPDNGSITILNYEEGGYSAEVINDTKHLDSIN